MPSPNNPLEAIQLTAAELNHYCIRQGFDKILSTPELLEVDQEGQPKKGVERKVLARLCGDAKLDGGFFVRYKVKGGGGGGDSYQVGRITGVHFLEADKKYQVRKVYCDIELEVDSIHDTGIRKRILDEKKEREEKKKKEEEEEEQQKKQQTQEEEGAEQNKEDGGEKEEHQHEAQHQQEEEEEREGDGEEKEKQTEGENNTKENNNNNNNNNNKEDAAAAVVVNPPMKTNGKEWLKLTSVSNQPMQIDEFKKYLIALEDPEIAHAWLKSKKDQEEDDEAMEFGRSRADPEFHFTDKFFTFASDLQKVWKQQVKNYVVDEREEGTYVAEKCHKLRRTKVNLANDVFVLAQRLQLALERAQMRNEQQRQQREEGFFSSTQQQQQEQEQAQLLDGASKHLQNMTRTARAGSTHPESVRAQETNGEEALDLNALDVGENNNNLHTQDFSRGGGGGGTQLYHSGETQNQQQSQSQYQQQQQQGDNNNNSQQQQQQQQEQEEGEQDVQQRDGEDFMSYLRRLDQDLFDKFEEANDRFSRYIKSSAREDTRLVKLTSDNRQKNEIVNLRGEKLRAMRDARLGIAGSMENIWTLDPEERYALAAEFEAESKAEQKDEKKKDKLGNMRDLDQEAAEKHLRVIETAKKSQPLHSPKDVVSALAPFSGKNLLEKFRRSSSNASSSSASASASPLNQNNKASSSAISGSANLGGSQNVFSLPVRRSRGVAGGDNSQSY